MDLFSIDLTVNEILFIRQTLDLPTISAKDAKFVGNLQTKIETELAQIEEMKNKAEQKKQKDLEELLKLESAKSSNKK
jgi:uncharacterized membrane protein YcgQ (UPF0703/DUF1980 family)